MSKAVLKKLFCLCLATITAASSVMLSFAEDGEAKAEKELNATATIIDMVDTTDNDANTFVRFYDQGYTPTLTPYSNGDGTTALLIDQTALKNVRILEINDKYKITNDITVNYLADKYVAFTKGTDGTYYILFANDYTEKDKGNTDNVSLVFVNLSKTGEVIRTCNVGTYGSGTPEQSDTFHGIMSVGYSNNAIAVNENYLTCNIGRMMFPNESGAVHQASYTCAIDLKDFKLVKKTASYDIPYVSHTFHNQIVKDGTDFLYIDRGDANPRAFSIYKTSGQNGWNEITDDPVTSFTFKGASGENNTYSQLGGLLKAGKNNNIFFLSGSYQNTDADFRDQEPYLTSANIFVEKFNAATLVPLNDVKYYTNYSDNYVDCANNGKLFTTVTNPKIVRTSDSQIAIPYMLSKWELEWKKVTVNGTLTNRIFLNSSADSKTSEEMHILMLDNNGAQADSIKINFTADNTVLPRYGTVIYNAKNNSIEWFSIKGVNLIVNSVCFDHKHNFETLSSTPATCLNEGSKKIKCTECGYETTEAIPKSDTHKPSGNWESGLTATCYSTGTEVMRCSDCNKIIDTRNTDKADHSPAEKWTVETPAKCGIEGEEVKRCTVCNEIVARQPVAMLQHKYEWKQTVPSSCTVHGKEMLTCIYCGDKTGTSRDLPLAEHNYKAYAKLDEAKHKKLCACGDYITQEHNWNSGVVTKQPTCINQGIKTFTCTDCQQTKEEKIAKLPMPTITVNTPVNKKIKYKDTLVLTSRVSNLSSEYYTIKWEAADSRYFKMNENGEACNVTPAKSGSTTFVAKLYYKNGQPILNESGEQIQASSVSITAKAGFFDKLFAIFRKGKILNELLGFDVI